MTETLEGLKLSNPLSTHQSYQYCTPYISTLRDPAIQHLCLKNREMVYPLEKACNEGPFRSE